MTRAQHDYKELAGKALDEHLADKHDWKSQMVANRGAVANRRDEKMLHYAESWHRIAHGGLLG